MKQTRLAKIFATGVACAAALGTALAQQQLQPHQQLQQQQQQQQTSTTANAATGTATTATAKGTFAAYTPGSTNFMFRPSPNAAPVRYYHTKGTVIVDPQGRTVDQSEIRPGVGATLYYTTEGDRMTVHKIVVGQPTAAYEKKETKTTKEKP